MPNNKQLFPARPSREELFHIAERWLERQHSPSLDSAPDANPMIVSSVLMAPMAMGYLLERPLSRILTQRREARQARYEEAVLLAEQHCRDLEPRRSLAELALDIVTRGQVKGD